MYAPRTEGTLTDRDLLVLVTVNTSYLSQWRNIRPLIVVRHFEDDSILCTTQCIKYIFIVQVKFAKRNVSNSRPRP